MTRRLPIVNADDGTWGDLLRDFLMKEHYETNTGSLDPANGGHKTITIRAGTATAGTAPLKFTSGTLLTTPEAGAIEYNGGFYMTLSGNARTAIVGADTVQTLTNKTLTSPVINNPTGIVKADVGLGNVDNTSDANKPVSSATQTALDAKAATTHKYHSFSNGQYFFDSYQQENYLRLFTENAVFSTTRFKTPVEVEYHDGVSWVSWSGGDASIKNLLDGRQDTGADIDHTHRRFRFKLQGQSYPTLALSFVQTFWTAITYPGCTMSISTSTSQVGTYTLRDTSTFATPNTQTNWGIHLKATNTLHTNESWYQIEVNWNDWTDSGGYTTVPMRRLEILSNYQGSSLLPFTWDWEKNLTGMNKVDGRDISVDGAKLDTIASGANVTQTGAETLTNKTLSSPTFSGSYSFGGTPTWPTFNQNTTGSAATLTTARTFQTNLASTASASFNGSANVTPGVTGTLPVGNGGTGRATATTAYGLIAAGTTATGAQQTIAPGASGQFLKSAGASALASFASITAADISDSTATGRSVLTATDAAAARTAIGAGTGNGDVTLSGAQTLTNKRVQPRVTSISSSATPSINTDSCDAVTITALAADITSMSASGDSPAGNLTGTPVNFQKLWIRIKDNGTARSITWGPKYQDSGVASLPTTTVAGKYHEIGLIWNSVLGKWVCVAVDTSGY